MSVYLLGIIHAPPGSKAYKNLPDGYSLNSDELSVLEGRVGGVALTVEHNGIHEAVDAATKSVDYEVKKDKT